MFFCFSVYVIYVLTKLAWVRASRVRQAITAWHTVAVITVAYPVVVGWRRREFCVRASSPSSF